MKTNLKKIKKIALVVFGLLANSFILSAQESPATLLEKKSTLEKEYVKFFLAPSIGFTQMDGDNTTLFYLRGGLTLKDKFSFGGYFNTSLNEINPQSETQSNVYMDYWSVGGFAEYTWNASKLVHMTFPVYIGMGEVQMDNQSGDAGLGEANFFQIEPSALIEVNLTNFLKLNFGVGYRLVGNMEYRNFNQSDISGLTGNLGLRVVIP